MRYNLLLECYKYGMHLGSTDVYNTNLNIFITGFRFGYAIIDLSRTLNVIKQSILFLKTLASNNGTICFFYSLFCYLNSLYKASLLSIVSRSFQSMITHAWLYGSLTNYYFSFFFFIKDIIGVLESDTGFVNLKTVRDLVIEKDIQQDTVHNTFLFLRRVSNNSLYTFLKKKKILNLKYFFLRFFFFLNEKQKDYLFLNKQVDLKDAYFLKITKRIHFYWRILIYYRHFQNIFELPDCFFSVFPNRNDAPLREICTTGEIVSIGLVDTNCSADYTHYPIVSNDDSLVIIFFFFTLFSNIFLESKMAIYNILKR